MAVVLHTSCGDLPVRLRYRECPKASFNFLALCAAGRYDGCDFYRHMPGVLLQTGDPTNTGKGGSSVYGLARDAASEATPSSPSAVDATPLMSPVTAIGHGRYFEDEGFGVTHHTSRGVLSMAHKGVKPDTNASQFFITLSAQPALDGLYTAFGEVVLGAAADPNTVASASDTLETPQLGEATLRALETAALPVDDKNIVVDKDKLKILGATIVYNPFADGTMHL